MWFPASGEVSYDSSNVTTMSVSMKALCFQSGSPLFQSGSKKPCSHRDAAVGIVLQVTRFRIPFSIILPGETLGLQQIRNCAHVQVLLDIEMGNNFFAGYHC